MPSTRQTPTTQTPPMDPDTSEATSRQLDLARAQGDAYGAALRHMTQQVAHDGGEQRAGDYDIGFAVEEAEGMYAWVDGALEWRAPTRENAHVEVSVRDAADGRFVPGLTVFVSLTTSDGVLVGTHRQPMLWHPMLYHYGRNWELPGDGSYTMLVRVQPPEFMRHDEVNGLRFVHPVEVEFTGVRIRTG